MHRRQNPGLQCHCSQGEGLKPTERPPLNSFTVKSVTGKTTSLNFHTSVGFSAGLRTAVRVRSCGSTLPLPNPGAPRCAKYLPSPLRSVPRALLYWVRPLPAPGQWPRLGQKTGIPTTWTKTTYSANARTRHEPHWVHMARTLGHCQIWKSTCIWDTPWAENLALGGSAVQ